MPSKKPQSSGIQQTAIGDGNIQIVGDRNTLNVNQTFGQRIINILRGDAETTELRNRRTMLGHVESFWVNGILEKSLYGAALIELGVKEEPDALRYPWAIKRGPARETLPAGMSMLEIFEQIGLGRSLLILGAPGSGKTTLLLELTRQFIQRARQDVTEPVPVVFNLCSWTGQMSLGDWLATELNRIYYVPRNIAPNWVKENKLTLFLDGLDEVRQESRNECVEAINQFRSENGLTRIAVCSRIQDYAELHIRLSLEGAIAIQPLTPNQLDDHFKRFGGALAGIQQLLKADIVLREMAETPLFLSIITLAYRTTQSQDIPIDVSLEQRRRQLFDTYVERMFERPERTNNGEFEKHDVLRWASWLARKMIEQGQDPYLLEKMQPTWLGLGRQWRYALLCGLISGLICGLLGGLVEALIYGLSHGFIYGPIWGCICGLMFGALSWDRKIRMSDALIWDWKQAATGLVIGCLFMGVIGALLSAVVGGPRGALIHGPSFAMIGGVSCAFMFGLRAKSISQTARPGQTMYSSMRNFLLIFLLAVPTFALLFALVAGQFFGVKGGLSSGLLFGTATAIYLGGLVVIQHYALRLIMVRNQFLPWRLIPFLDYCVDRIFLRRVGGGYIFIHRLLMEHFAAMYSESEE